MAGERRWRAAQRAGCTRCRWSCASSATARRSSWRWSRTSSAPTSPPLEEAEAYRRLIEEFGHTQEALAEGVGKSRSHIANTLRLLGLPPAVRAMLGDGRLTAGHARALLPAREPERLAATWSSKGLNVRQTEDLVRHEAAAPRAKPEPSPDIADLERQLTARTGLEVGLKSRGKGGVMTIRWRDEDQLGYLLERLR